MKKTKLALAASLMILAFGQSTLAGDRFQASLNFLMGYPQNDFKMNVDRTFYGLSGEFFYHFPSSLFSVGISLEYMNYGSETRIEPFSYDIPDVLVDVTTRNSIFSSAAVLRLSPVEGPFRPYVEALSGSITCSRPLLSTMTAIGQKISRPPPISMIGPSPTGPGQGPSSGPWRSAANRDDPCSPCTWRSAFAISRAGMRNTSRRDRSAENMVLLCMSP